MMGILQSEYIRGILRSGISLTPLVTYFRKQSTEDINEFKMGIRATVVVLKDNKVLLVWDRGKPRYSLPGGGIEHNETTITAGTRELNEELRLPVHSITRCYEADFKGSLSFHKVCLATIDNEPHLTGNELDRFIWWDMKSKIPIYPHVIHILQKLQLLS